MATQGRASSARTIVIFAALPMPDYQACTRHAPSMSHKRARLDRRRVRPAGVAANVATVAPAGSIVAFPTPLERN
jgi:hypothetical protein